jgi:hypothetical protein
MPEEASRRIFDGFEVQPLLWIEVSANKSSPPIIVTKRVQP